MRKNLPNIKELFSFTIPKGALIETLKSEMLLLGE